LGIKYLGAIGKSSPLFTFRFRVLVRLGLVLSALFGFYVSDLRKFTGLQTYAMLAISVSDLCLALILTFVPRLYNGSVAASIMAEVIQLADLAANPHYSSGIPYYTLYLFGFLAFDAVLITGFVIGVASFLSTNRSTETVPIEQDEGS